MTGSRLLVRPSRVFGLLLTIVIPTTTHGERVITATRIATGFNNPVYLTTAPGDSDRLYVVEQHRGRVMMMDRNTGDVAPTPFVQVPGISGGNEQGLLGMAFDPNYDENGFFYVNYTDVRAATNVVRYQVSGETGVADPDSATSIMTIPQPQSNHNGGWMDFGPSDGFLYVGVGDGGGGNDDDTGHTPGVGNAQDITDNLLGKMLRIDVSNDAFPEDPNANYAIPAGNPFVGVEGDDEIWAYGLRNPWRSSFDREMGHLYIGDVGQGAREEINFQPTTSSGGENYGWRLREGSIATPGVGGPAPPESIEPIYDYRHDGSSTGGFSVTGGYVYRGPIKALDGRYFFADFVSSQFSSFRFDGNAIRDFQVHTESIVADEGDIASVASFGEDQEGNLYILSLDGDIFRLDNVANLSEIVAAGSEWRYLDDGSDQGTAWPGPGYDDSGWKSGPAQLGYGDGDEQTIVGFGEDSRNKFATTYFRHTFDVSDPESIDRLLLNVLRDDGAAVYLNGTEVFRTENLAPDAGFSDLANFNGSSAIGGRSENTFLNAFVDGQLLIPGTNILAVEVHQHSHTSPDLSFDLRLSSLTDLIEGIAGDLNQDGQLDVQDIDELTRAVSSGDGFRPYDLNTDGKVNDEDRRFWIHDLKATWVGDANLDGEFNETDLTFVLQAGEFEDGLTQNSSWSEGDWDGDLDFTTSDLVASLSDGGYLQGPFVAPVPEPDSMAHFVTAVGIVAVSLRQARRHVRVRRKTGFTC